MNSKITHRGTTFMEKDQLRVLIAKNYTKKIDMKFASSADYSDLIVQICRPTGVSI